MIADPLTDEQKQDFLAEFGKQVIKRYNNALRSGVLSQDDIALNKDSYILLRCVILITANKECMPLSDESRRLLVNLNKFV